MTTSPPGTLPAGSIAPAEFAAARATARRPVDDPRRRLPLTFTGPAGPATDRLHVDEAAPVAPAGATGPIGRALGELAAGRVTAEELLDRSLAAVARRDGDLRAIVDLDAAAARDRAAWADEERAAAGPDDVARRPLLGVPLTVKDVIDVAGLATRAGSLAYHDRPASDAVAVARLRAAGAVILAKTSTHEFALGVTNPQSGNPHDPTRIPGGSSGGSAAAVAAGMGLGSLGTDTRASIRVPAALSGVVGLKPTFGRVPTGGVVTLAWTMDHVGPLAASVADAALLLDVLDHGVPGAPIPTLRWLAARTRRLPVGSGPGGRLRVGVPAAGFTGADPAVAGAVRAAIEQLAGLGADVVEVDRPHDGDFDDASACGLVVSRSEAATAHRRLGTDLDRCWPEVADQLREAGRVPATDYLDAQRRRGQLAEELLELFATVDVLALPTALVTAPPATEAPQFLMVLARNAIPWSFVGFPAISLPCGTGRDGLPIGLQLVAPPDTESGLVATAAAVEHALRRTVT